MNNLYLQFNKPIVTSNLKKLFIGDMIVLHSVLDLTCISKKHTEDISKLFLQNNIQFTVISNCGDIDGSISHEYIIIKPIKNKKLKKSYQYKVNINNIKYIDEDSTGSEEVTGIVATFKVSKHSVWVDTFDNKYFPNYEIDNIAELNDRVLVDIYSKNISKSFNFKEVEIELRTFQNEEKYGGFKNTINSSQYSSMVQFFSDSEDFYTMHTDPTESVDIFLEDIPNLRFTISGKDDIFKFCSDNKITVNNTELIYKDSVLYKEDEDLYNEKDTDTNYVKHFGSKRKDNDFSKGIFNLYSLRTKLGGKIEIPFSKSSDDNSWELDKDSISKNSNINSSIEKAEHALSKYNLLVRNNGNRFLKLFRLKSRMSFMYNNFIRIDLTKTKMSKENIIQKGRFIDIHKQPTYSFIDSGIVNQEESYECEIELVNIHLIESSKFLKTLQEQIGIAINIIKFMNAIINERVGFVHSNVKDYVLEIYNLQVQQMMKKRCETLGKMFYPDNFKNKYISPNVISIELFNLVGSYNININRDYCVTDKADGLANMLFVLGTKGLNVSDITVNVELRNKLEGGLFFIDSNLQVYNSYIELSGKGIKASYILNGEYLNFNKLRHPMNSYGIYDAYLYGSEDISSRILLRPDALDGTSSDIKGINDDSPIYQVSPEYKDGEPQYETYSHTNEPGYLEWSREDFIKRFITLDKTQINTVSKNEDEDDPLLRWNNLDIFAKEFLSADTEATIFDKSGEIWNLKDEKEYKLDGLIYTPVNVPVAHNDKKTNYPLYQWTTWDKNLKWKPPEDNTIDFLIKFRKVEWQSYKNSKIYKKEIRGKTSSKDKYFIVEFYNTGREGVYNKIKPIRFTPDKDIDLIGLLKVDNNKTYDLEDNEIRDNTIVEVSYDKDANEYERFKILRTRHDKTYQYRFVINKQKNEFKKIERAIELMKERFLTNSQRSFKNYIQRKYFKVKKSNGSFKTLSNITELEGYFKDYSDVHLNEKYNFGNSVYVANNIWKSIHEPVTEEMITTGENIPELESISSKYYTPGFKSREESLTINLQSYHNKVIKSINLLDKVCNLLYISNSDAKIRLLDLACGKGGDIYKWRKNNIKRCIGIDINSDNINNGDNGAWVRYAGMKESFQKAPDIEFLCMNTSENILERFPSKFEKEAPFDIITLMFALHYFFKDKDTLDGLIKNIDAHLKEGGYFIGACFNGKRLFNTLKTNGSINISKDGKVIFNVEKIYTNKSFSDTKTSLGKEISVFMHSIGNTINEYLVNFDYLDKELKKINIIREDVIDFADIVLSNNELKKLRLKRMSTEEKEISNLNSLFIYKRGATQKTKKKPKRTIKKKAKKSATTSKPISKSTPKPKAKAKPKAKSKAKPKKTIKRKKGKKSDD